MLSTDLSDLYGVEHKVLNQQVRRNLDRFPTDFMFQLTQDEYDEIRYFKDAEIDSEKRGGVRRALPYAFTEQGVAMLSSVLRSERAVQVNIAVMRAFVSLRELLSSNKDLAERLEELESKYDAQFRQVFDAIREMMIPEDKPKRKIGFAVPEK